MPSELAPAAPAQLRPVNSVAVPAERLAAAPAEVPARPAGAPGAGGADVSVARRMVRYLVDRDTFVEFGSQVRHRATAFGAERSRPAGDGVVTGVAEVAGRPVSVYAQDPGALGGSLGEMHTAKITRIMMHAARSRTPVVGLIDSSGGRIQEGVDALDGCGALLRANVALSGRVPQVSVVLGSCAGGATFSPAMTDVLIMARDRGQMFLTGPRVVRAVTHEDITADRLGGPELHSRRSGLVHLLARDAPDALAMARHVLSYLPGSCEELPPVVAPRPADLMPCIPDNQRLTYDVRTVIGGVVDAGSFLELQARHARNLVIGLARIEGGTVGVVANQPQALAGTLDIASAEKGARFVRMCDAFSIPLVVLVDTPGYLPGLRHEENGVARRGGKLLAAFAQASVPRVTVILRKAFGGAYVVMNSKAIGADAVFAWPQAQIAVMGAEGAVEILHRRELVTAPHRRPALVEQYRAQAMAPEPAAHRLSVDEIVSPDRTRPLVAATLRSLAGALRPAFRHDNLPQ
jgi:acetyl-CoA carboxylase carboxyltransferase component